VFYVKHGVLNTSKGISIHFCSKNVCAVHMFEFLLAETHKADGMAELKIFVTLWGSIATFFHFGD
jgi:hypothetical protein